MSATKVQKRVKEETLRKLAKDAGMGVTARKRAGTTEEYWYLFRRVPGANRILWQYLGPSADLGDMTKEAVVERIDRLEAKVTAATEGRELPKRELPPIEPAAVMEAIGTGASLKEIAEKLNVSARSPRLKAVITQLEADGKIKAGRYYVPTATADKQGA